MTQLQVKWAANHDWFVFATNGIVVAEEVLVKIDTGESASRLVTFDSYRKLWQWAGY